MGEWRQRLFDLASAIDDRADRVRYGLTRRRPRRGPARVVPYRGYGTAEAVRLSGRVLEGAAAALATDRDTWRTNLRNMLRRLESDEVPGARVRARFGGVETEATTDGEGYFHVAIEPREPLDPTRAWHEVEVELVDPPPADPRPVEAGVLVPPPTARFAVVSDVDDTVVFTNVTDKLRMARIVFLEGARTRLPFEGVAAFYEALRSGASGGEGNPIFYVSSSPWNLYDLLAEMFEFHGIPAGPMLLRDFGISSEGLIASDSTAHKLSKIRPLLDLYPGLPFLLVGDSGEKDPEIYGQIVREYPGRILAVYIRHVAANPERERAVEKLAEEVLAAGSQLVLARDSRFAAEHAASKGWIVADALGAVEESAERDRRSPAAAEPVPQSERPPERAVEG